MNGCQIHRLPKTATGVSPKKSGSDGTIWLTTNNPTLAQISNLTIGVAEPGPKV